MKELSVFIDESGDFGEFDPKSPYYIIGMVLHNQKNDISSQIQYLNKVLSETELKRNFVHMGATYSPRKRIPQSYAVRTRTYYSQDDQFYV